MAEIFEKSQAVLQELEDKLRENKLQKIKADIVPLTYSPSAKKNQQKWKNQSGQKGNYNTDTNQQNKDLVYQFRELLATKKLEFNTICDSLMVRDTE